MTETNGRTDRRGTEAEVAEWRTRNTERGVGIVREMVEVRERKREDEGRRERSRTEEELGREKNDCFHDYNGEEEEERGR